jgi:DNA invertase Pin-like site-specific DNA recombinase
MLTHKTAATARPKLVGYIRVSTDTQAVDGVSLAAQRDKIEQFARLYDYELIAVIEDAGASAKTLNRDGLNQALAMLESGEAGALIVAKLDRLTRSVKDLGELLENRFTRFSLVSVGEEINTSTAAGRLVLNVLMSVAQWEREAISERTKTALQHKKAQGQRVGAIPYGYSVGSDGQTLEANPAEQEVIKAVLKYRAAGLGFRLICQRLESDGFKTRSDGGFHPKSVSRIIDSAPEAEAQKRAA